MRTTIIVFFLALVSAAPSCPGEIDSGIFSLVPVEDGHVVLSFRAGRAGRADVVAARLVAAPAVDRVIQEPWPTAEDPNLEYDGQLNTPWPGAAAGEIDITGRFLVGDGHADLRRVGRDQRRPGLPDVTRFRGHVPLGERDRGVGIEWSAFLGYPGSPPWVTTSDEPAELLWCPLTGSCVSWEQALRGIRNDTGRLVEYPRVYCADETAPGGDPKRAAWLLRACKGSEIPEGVRVVREDAPADLKGLVRTAIQATTNEDGDFLVIEPAAGVPALKWTIATRSHDEYADGRREEIAGCAAGGTLRILASCGGWSDDTGPLGCRYDWQRAVGPDEVVAVDFYDGAESIDAASSIWIEMRPGLCLAALAGAPGQGEQAWWSPDGPAHPYACDLAELVEGPGWSQPGCPRQPPAALEYSTEPLRCEDGICRIQ